MQEVKKMTNFFVSWNEKNKEHNKLLNYFYSKYKNNVL